MRRALRGRALTRPNTATRVAGCIATLVFLAVSTAVGAAGLDENQLKAAYLFNFARYVEWPSTAHTSPTSALEIGVVGGGTVSDLLKKTVLGKKVRNRTLRVVNFKSSADARKSHILFVPGSLSAEELRRIIADLKGTHVFVVADSAKFAQFGGIANFIVAESRVRFAINENAAKSAGLKVSSKLLRLAELVE